MPNIFKSSLPPFIPQGIFQILFMVKRTDYVPRFMRLFAELKQPHQDVIKQMGLPPITLR